MCCRIAPVRRVDELLFGSQRDGGDRPEEVFRALRAPIVFKQLFEDLARNQCTAVKTAKREVLSSGALRPMPARIADHQVHLRMCIDVLLDLAGNPRRAGVLQWTSNPIVEFVYRQSIVTCC